MNVNTARSVRPSLCSHWPPMLVIIATAWGYTARCVTCGQTGPERESKDGAWAALMVQRRGIGEP